MNEAPQYATADEAGVRARFKELWEALGAIQTGNDYLTCLLALVTTQARLIDLYSPSEADGFVTVEQINGKLMELYRANRGKRGSSVGTTQ
jgi:hypothetical protein